MSCRQLIDKPLFGPAGSDNPGVSCTRARCTRPSGLRAAAAGVALRGGSSCRGAAAGGGAAGVHVLARVLSTGRVERSGTSTCMSCGAGSSCEAHGISTSDPERHTAGQAAVHNRQGRAVSINGLRAGVSPIHRSLPLCDVCQLGEALTCCHTMRLCKALLQSEHLQTVGALYDPLLRACCLCSGPTSADSGPQMHGVHNTGPIITPMNQARTLS